MVFMKVLCLIDGLGSGGAQRQLVGLASLLKKEGYDVLVVYYHGDHFFVPFLIFFFFSFVWYLDR